MRRLLPVPLLLTGVLALPAHAGCSASGVRGTDPGKAAINAAIDQAASRRHVPPYVLKAIAWQESRWRQFYSDGRAVVSGACAIGVMQVLPRGFDAQRLATDYRYNVDAGAQVLAAKMNASSANVPPALGADDQRVAENWYRATYRYNGSGYAAMRYADAVFASVRTPASDLRSWVVPVNVVNPRDVIPGYTPQSGHGYVAHLDGTWASTLGSYRHAVVRADYLAALPRTTAGRTLEGDQTAGSMFVARNIGWATWTGSHVSLSTYPVGRASRLRHPRWVAATRPVALAVATPTGGDARFGFSVQAARVASAVTVSEAFVPVLDGSVVLGARGASTWTLNPARTPTAAVTSAPEYVSDAATDSTARIGLSFADPSPGSGVAYVEVSRRAPGATAWSTPSRVTTTAIRVALSGAGTHAFRVRAVDRAGHVSAWTDPTPVVVPRDDADATLTFAGDWTRPSVSGSWLGSLATAPAGASVETTVNGTSYALIGTRGPGLARLTVYLDGVLVTVVTTDAEATAQRQVLWRAALAPGDHALRVVVGDATAPPADDARAAPPVAYLDAVAVGTS
ncbi:MAG TPA: transglycosylase SLT domain-containing protein [Mycobacteriales bacterium]|jgi:hypothetical protein|nr:transglycosylase SLT domain-containing protein [Mycobacteriales bacterium]